MRLILRIRPSKRMLHLARMSPAPSRRGRGAVSSRERRWRGAWQLDRMEHRGPVLLHHYHHHYHHHHHHHHLQLHPDTSPTPQMVISCLRNTDGSGVESSGSSAQSRGTDTGTILII